MLGSYKNFPNFNPFTKRIRFPTLKQTSILLIRLFPLRGGDGFQKTLNFQAKHPQPAARIGWRPQSFGQLLKQACRARACFALLRRQTLTEGGSKLCILTSAADLCPILKVCYDSLHCYWNTRPACPKCFQVPLSSGACKAQELCQIGRWSVVLISIYIQWFILNIFMILP